MANWITGREIIVGLDIAATWREPVSVNAVGKGLLITAESMGAKAPNYLADDSLGQDDIDELIRTSEAITGGGLTGYFRFQDWDMPLAMALGSAASPATAALATLTMQATYSMSSNIDGIFGTLAMKKAGTTYGVWEIPSVKFTGFTIHGAVNELATIETRYSGNKIETVGASNTTLSTVSYTDSPIAVMNTRFAIRMNTSGCAALTDADKIYPQEFEVIMDRPMDEPYEAGHEDMSEPVQDGFAEVTLNMTFDKYSMDTYMSSLDDSSTRVFKLDIEFEGKIIEGVRRYGCLINMPKVQFTQAESTVGGPGKIGHVVTGRCLRVASAVTGMVGTDPINIIMTNTRTTNVLL